MTPETVWEPHPGPQTRFLQTRAHEVLYGGQAGGGKSAGLIAMPLRWVGNPNFSALVLRRDTTQLADLLKKAQLIYPRFHARAARDGASVTWRFPSGATVWFTHCQHEDDVSRFDGGEWQLCEFDELTHFTEKQYLGVRARIRSPHPGLPRYTRSTSNPGGVGHDWVLSRWAAWLDTADGKKPLAAPGELLWFATINGVEQCVPEGTLGDKDIPAMSRTFIPARIVDNPSIAVNDPTYIATLNSLDPVRRAQLLEGDWMARPAAGAYFRRQWFQIVEQPPAEVLVRVRYWDRAATKPHEGNKDPDWTRGVRMSLDRDGIWYVEHVASERDQPHVIKRLIRQTAETDGRRVVVGIEQDPGQAGVAEAHDYARELAGWNVRLYRPTGDKVTRAQPVSAQAGAGNVRIVRGNWNTAFLDELESFPEGGHDDIVDSLSGAFNAILMLKQPVRTQPITTPLSELG